MIGISWAILAGGCGKKQGCMDPRSINFDPQAELNTETCQYPLSLTQKALDSTLTPVKARLTGALLSISLAHDGSPRNGTNTVRDIFSNIPTTQIVAPGTLFTKRTYEKDSLGNPGKLLVTFYMYKQPVGYYSAGGDYEYGVMPYDSTVNYTQHPNGLIPKSSASRGKIAFCSGCHSNGGSDFIFTR